MESVQLADKSFQSFISASQINKKIKLLSAQINKDYAGKKPIFVAILNGSFMFCSDLLKQIELECKVSFLKLSSYDGMSTTGNVRQLIGLNEDIKGQDLIVLEDIMDTGLTLAAILKELAILQPSSIQVCTLLYKPAANQTNYVPSYIGFEVGNEFLVGYGLDYNGLGRNLPEIYQYKSLEL
jgi:hypoxanthine phosphoribosyltransferase